MVLKREKMGSGRMLLLSVIIFTLQALCYSQETGDVRLFKGNELSMGIVQLYHNSTWTTVCGHTFTDQAAQVTCRQLGFERGTALPSGAFGVFYNNDKDIVPYVGQFQKCVTGQESRLVDCEFTDLSSCSTYLIAYASVVCMTGPKPSDPDVRVKLESNQPFPEAGYFSPVKVYGSEIWGRVCGQFWDDNDARVICRQLGYYDGVATYSSNSLTVPLLITEINCLGNETNLLSCPQSNTICYGNRSAAVVCHQNENQGPSVSLVGGKANYGKVVLSIDGKSGLICNTSKYDNISMPWGYNEATAVCRQLGYNTGSVIQEQYDTGSVTNVVLDGFTCRSEREESLLNCQQGGWGDVSTQCMDRASGVSVYCFSEVRLIGSGKLETEQLHIGRVEIFDSGSFYGVCASVFSQEVAMVTCRQFGFPQAEVMLPGSFGSSFQRYEHISSITCSGSEDRIANCTYTLGQCENDRMFHAALLCKQPSTPDSYTFSLTDDYYGDVLVERYGITGHVCREGWDDNDAIVMCKKAGYVSGVQLNTYTFFRETPFWVSNFSCTGPEASLTDCGYQTDMSTDWDCAGHKVSAGVLCFNNKPPEKLVRLADGVSANHGRAEVYNDVTGWATLCDSSWGNNDARVFCRQAGFADGQVHPSAFRTPIAENDEMKVALSSLRCDGTEATIFECGSSGWLSVSSSCQSHKRDAGVYCYDYVKLSTFSYGSVQYHTGEEYGLVCADGFDTKAAAVLCKQYNFGFSVPVCCSGFGPSTLEFSMSNVQCSGSEASLRECSYIDNNPVCSSGHYAGVVCAHYNPGFTKILAVPEVKINYFAHDGYVCTEDFTDADAQVVCRVNAFLYGRAFKASGQGLENQIRWLRGLGCSGAETNVFQCGVLNWGQIGVCSWDSVAAAICSDTASDMDFEIRLNGSDVSGRVEIKVKGEWGTVCGEDFTRDEASVVCRQLNFHAGINMPAGHSGPGTGEVILSGIECAGNETSVTECIWSGYGDSVKRCDHSKDAAVTCFYNTRLVGSTTINYGRLEMYDKSTDKWLAVCDRNINVNNGNIICRQMGYVGGMFQEGSPLGPTSTEISIVSIDCADTSECTFETGACWSDKYVALYCGKTNIINENVAVRLPLSSFYGPVSIQRFGLWGHICSNGFDDNDALVVCSQIGYGSGIALKTYATNGFPIIQGSVDCSGDEANIENCARGLFADDHGCYATDTVAAVLCYNEPGLSYGTTDLDHETGRMSTGVEIKANGKSLFISQVKFTDTDAAVYCYTLDYAGGETYHAGSGSYGVTDLSCDGTEESILNCPAVWDPEKTRDKIGDLAGATCYTAVRLVGGDPKYYGVVFTSKGVNSGPVCATGFERVDADVACSSLGFSAGLVLCCAPFGNVDEQPVITNVQCTGREKHFTDCVHEDARGTRCSRDYAAVACYSGTKPAEYTLSLPGTDTSNYAGNLVLTYMGIDGGICMDEWDNNDAHVACRELGYQTGIAYNAAKSVTGPYWTSQVNCNGDEEMLSQCQFIPFGEVSECKTLQSHAGVICYDNEGIFSRLFGSGESRYGRAELSVAGEWRSICNTHWDNEDAHVLCRMLDFRTGEAFQETYNETLQGPVWDINFMCNGSEESLTECLSSGWKSATSETCARHTNDAGAFCYTSVKLSTGVGRRTDQGAVLMYKDDTWYTLCADDFTDQSAQAVCRELGFEDGLSRCCSPFGDLSQYPRLETHKVMCNGSETDVTDCLVEGECTGEDYASVVCFGFILTTTEGVTKLPVSEEGFDPLPIIIAVIVFICLVVIFVIVVYVIRKQRRRKKFEASRQNFDSTMIREETDGSLHVENRLHGVAATPEVPRVAYGNRGDGQHFASISPAYRNAGYSTPFDVNAGNIPVSTPETRGQNRTVLDVRTSKPYDNPVASNNTEDPHLYDSIKPHLYDSVKSDYLHPTVSQPRHSDENTGGDNATSTDNHFNTALANQDEVASPTEDKTEPHFLQVADIDTNQGETQGD